MEKIEDLRKKLDEIDEAMSGLFAKRMEICKKIAEYKYDNSLPIVNATREAEIAQKIRTNPDPIVRLYYGPVSDALLDASKKYQEVIIKNK